MGVLMLIAEDDPQGQARIGALRQGLQELGWSEGRNIRIDYRLTADQGRARAYASELLDLNPDVIFAGTPPAVAALKEATRTVPIIFAQVPDPIALGFVTSMARPGGNITGFSLYEFTIGVKWLELLKQIAPGVARVSVVYSPATPSWVGYLTAVETGAAPLGIQLSAAPARDAAEIERAIVAVATEPNAGLLVLPGPLIADRELIVNLAARYRLPAVYPYRFFVATGGLASYGADNVDLYRRAASYVDRILKGEKAAVLPVQAASKFELVINLKTAAALGLDPPVSLLARTDEVIE